MLKPVNVGSSVGVAIVTAEGNYGNPISPEAKGPWQEFASLLAEPYIRGKELTTAVLADKALLVTELKPKSGFYDFDSKYTDGMTEHVCPAEIPDEITEACKELALRAHRLLGCKGATRSDFRWDDERGLDGLKGHRSVGGMRASIYNAFPAAGVDALIAAIREFERTQS